MDFFNICCFSRNSSGVLRQLISFGFRVDALIFWTASILCFAMTFLLSAVFKQRDALNNKLFYTHIDPVNINESDHHDREQINKNKISRSEQTLRLNHLNTFCRSLILFF